MQAVFIFAAIFSGIFGGVCILRIAYNALMCRLINKGKGRGRNGK